MRRIRSIRLRVVVCAGALVTVCGVGYAAAAVPGFVDASGHINSCLPPGGGQVHVWHPGHGCSGGWVPLQFAAQTGPTGPQGATGPSGPQGPTGATGPVNPDAASVDGETVTKLTLKEPTPASSTTVQTLYSASGLTILAECDSSGAASLQATGPASADAELTVSGTDNDATTFGSQTSTLGPNSFAALGPPSSGQTSFSYASNTGAVVTGTIGYQRAPSFGTYSGCGFFGTATAG
jgi:hypothetical protein